MCDIGTHALKVTDNKEDKTYNLARGDSTREHNSNNYNLARGCEDLNRPAGEIKMKLSFT